MSEAALSDMDKIYLQFATIFEQRYINQEEYENRTIEQTLNVGWELLRLVPRTEMKRVREEYLKKYYDQ